MIPARGKKPLGDSGKRARKKENKNFLRGPRFWGFYQTLIWLKKKNSGKNY